MNIEKGLIPLAEGLLAQARATRQRRLVVLAGERDWAVKQVQAATAAIECGEVLWITDAPPAGSRATRASHAHKLLGEEVDAVVFDIYAGLDVEAFGAVAGAVRGGGLMLLLAPPLDHWEQFTDPEQRRIAVHPYSAEQVSRRFLRRFARVIARSESASILVQGATMPLPPRVAVEATPPPAADDLGCITPDQRRAVEAILALVRDPSPRPLVLTSDRGRGKSAALGLAAAALLHDGARRILITAPRFDAAAVIFAHAQRALPRAARVRDAVTLRDARLQFVAPDALDAVEPPEILLVDEAAAIPVPLLVRFLERAPRVVFATTVHGYEGSGRGFANRFQSLLDARKPGWQGLRLEQPVRFASGDPLEKFSFDALLLAANAAPDEIAAAARPANCRFERLDRDRLADDEATLSELFGLLVLAHYRTSPLDLRYLLDGPNITVWAARHQGHVVAAALVATEGGFEAGLARAVWEGRRRPRGHLLAQSLAAHAGFVEAPTLVFERVMRIAVHPAAQHHGLGTALVEAIEAHGRAQGADAIGASFGASVDLLGFWARTGLRPVRLGVTREAASAAPAAMVLRPCSARGAALYLAARAHYLDTVPWLLADPLRDLAPELGAALVARTPEDPPPSATLDAHAWRELAAYAAGVRDYELVLGPLHRLVEPVDLVRMPRAERALVDARLFRHATWPDLVQAFGLRGREDAAQRLRGSLRPLILERGGTSVQDEVVRIENNQRGGEPGLS